MLGNRGFPEAWSRLCVCQASFLMTFATGGIPHAGPRHNMLLEISGEVTPERMKGWSQSKNNTQLWIGDRRDWWLRKVKCCKGQYCIEVWHVRSMNQGKLEVVEQEMTRVSIDILEISELRWTEIGVFNLDDHYIYYYGKEDLRRNGVPIIVNKNLKCRTWMQSQKRQNDLCSFLRQTIQCRGNPSLCFNQ